MRTPVFVVLFAALATTVQSAEPQPRRLVYAPAPVDNPLKGLVPYQGDARGVFPHSLEFNYLAYAAIVKGYDDFDWKPLETLLNDIASRGHQAVIRIYLEYPGKKGAIPDFLVADGLKVHQWQDKSTPNETPDYENKHLRRSLQSFLVAFGKKYDGDPRLGFITAGLLGAWGEWHNFPKEELFASKAVQREVMDAYESAFQTTPVLLRYPAGEKGGRFAPNAGRRFGYHDDSFAWATLHTGKTSDQWFYMTTLKVAGPAAEVKWKTQPIGGEIRPEAWGKVFDEKPGVKEIQNFRECVESTHATWLMDSGIFRKNQPADRIKRAESEVRRMGYEFHVPEVAIGEVNDGKLPVSLAVENRGVAPFYSDWKSEYGLLLDGKAVMTFKSTGKLIGLLPEEKPRIWKDSLDLTGVKAGRYTLALRVPNPIKGGKGLRFANETQDKTTDWLVLGEVMIR